MTRSYLLSASLSPLLHYGTPPPPFFLIWVEQKAVASVSTSVKHGRQTDGFKLVVGGGLPSFSFARNRVPRWIGALACAAALKAWAVWPQPRQRGGQKLCFRAFQKKGLKNKAKNADWRKTCFQVDRLVGGDGVPPLKWHMGLCYIIVAGRLQNQKVHHLIGDKWNTHKI